jgi:hypothetical protein
VLIIEDEPYMTEGIHNGLRLEPIAVDIDASAPPSIKAMPETGRGARLYAAL